MRSLIENGSLVVFSTGSQLELIKNAKFSENDSLINEQCALDNSYQVEMDVYQIAMAKLHQIAVKLEKFHLLFYSFCKFLEVMLTLK